MKSLTRTYRSASVALFAIATLLVSTTPASAAATYASTNQYTAFPMIKNWTDKDRCLLDPNSSALWSKEDIGFTLSSSPLTQPLVPILRNVRYTFKQNTVGGPTCMFQKAGYMTASAETAAASSTVPCSASTMYPNAKRTAAQLSAIEGKPLCLKVQSSRYFYLARQKTASWGTYEDLGSPATGWTRDWAPQDKRLLISWTAYINPYGDPACSIRGQYGF